MACAARSPSIASIAVRGVSCSARRSVDDHRPAVAQHGDRVCDREDVLEEVRDEDHADPGVAQIPHHVEQPRVSAASSAEVGSSRIRTRGSRSSARQISTRWRSPRRSRPSGPDELLVESDHPEKRPRARAHLPTTDQRTATRLPGQEQVLQHVELLEYGRAPAPPRQCRGRRPRRCRETRTGWPSRYSSPVDGRSAPARTFIRVDLPAPLAPSSAWTSPGSICIETSVERERRAVALGDVACLVHAGHAPARASRAARRRRSTPSALTAINDGRAGDHAAPVRADRRNRRGRR